jgi:uncharacterized protein (TIGR03437 family)
MLARLIVSLGLISLTLVAQETVRFKTNFGDIDVLMLRSSAPLHVDNFLGYVKRGDYSNTIFHRASSFGSANASIIQGGGFNTSLGPINSGSSVRLEYREANARGTLAMARTSSINSATNQWYFNVTNNTTTLGPGNGGGYTVFGRITNSAGLGVIDKIAAVPIYNLDGGTFAELPLQNYKSGNPTTANFVIVNSVEILAAESTNPAINDGGAVTVTGFGGFNTAAPGSWIEIYGKNFGTATREWAGGDFTDGRAPTSLEEVSVTIGGTPAFVRYVSPGQLNVQVPDVSTGGALPVVVTVKGQASAALMLDVQSIAPGIYAPPSFKYNNAQFVTAVRPATGALINSVVPGIPFTDAVPGETLLFYGVGFGKVTPNQPVAGQIITGIPSVIVPVKFKIGDKDATVSYAGLVAGSLGLYQFNVVIPPSLTRGDVKVEIEVDGKPLRQPTLYLPVTNPPAQ